MKWRNRRALSISPPLSVAGVIAGSILSMITMPVSISIAMFIVLAVTTRPSISPLAIALLIVRPFPLSLIALAFRI
jgi:hypothetical protein